MEHEGHSQEPDFTQPEEVTPPIESELAQPIKRNEDKSIPSRAKLYKQFVQATSEAAASIYADHRIKNNPEKKPLDLQLIDRFVAKRLALQSETNLELPDGAEKEVLKEIQTLYSSVWRWHGTGRYEHRNDSEIVDVLHMILKDNGLLPQPDTIDHITGPSDSISTARSRMYARPYADMHQDRDQPLSYRYGKPSYWGKYFMSPVPIEVAIEGKLWNKKNREEASPEVYSGMQRWRDKVNKTPHTLGLYNALDEGSDIAGNYPILIGLKEMAFEEGPISKTLARHESRSTTNITIDSFTHIEVPLNKVDEVRQILEQNNQTNLPVIPIELGEYYCSQFEFSDLASGRPLTPDRPKQNKPE